MTHKKLFFRGKLRDVNASLDNEINTELDMGDVFSSKQYGGTLGLHFQITLPPRWYVSMEDEIHEKCPPMPLPYLDLIFGYTPIEPAEEGVVLSYLSIHAVVQQFMDDNRRGGGDCIWGIEFFFIGGLTMLITFY
mgnify:CR=1 FL=1